MDCNPATSFVLGDLTPSRQLPSIQTYPLSAYTNTGTVLDRILEARRAEIEHRKAVLPEAALKYGAKAAGPVRDFPGALSRDGLNVIAELKPASPSRGVLRDPFDATELARVLAGAGAAALSVLTEGQYFHGSLKNLRDARKAVELPVLRKDFIFDPWQVWEARANDADSFLLIVAVLDDSLLRELIALGRVLGMEPLVEVHTAPELERAIDASARIIGVNNRDLKTMAVRTETSFELIEKVPEECLAVSESGIGSHQDLFDLRRAGFDGFLIGEHLMLAEDPAAALSGLLKETPLEQQLLREAENPTAAGESSAATPQTDPAS
jgi:indole-3-glycerol phosphate synthase